MIRWFRSRERREQRALLAATAASVLFLAYSLWWQPLDRDLHRLRATVAQQRATLHWMQRAAAEVQRLRAAGVTISSNARRRPLLSIADGSARSSGLHQSVSRLEPRGNNRVRIWLERAPFDRLVAWLAALQQHDGVVVDSASLRRAGAGLVNATLELSRVAGGEPARGPSPSNQTVTDPVSYSRRNDSVTSSPDRTGTPR
jgi:general secretion pathway protein M